MYALRIIMVAESTTATNCMWQWQRVNENYCQDLLETIDAASAGGSLVELEYCVGVTFCGVPVHGPPMPFCKKKGSKFY
jgi:hypothetical protein